MADILFLRHTNLNVLKIIYHSLFSSLWVPDMRTKESKDREYFLNITKSRSYKNHL